MEDKLFFDGEEYISARRASEISGYNSDYLGQLCRGEKLQCRLISRTWFVEENSLLEHLKTNGRKKTSPLFLEAQVQDKRKIFFTQNEKAVAGLFRSNLVRDLNFFRKVFAREFLATSLLALLVTLSISLAVISLSGSLIKDGGVPVLGPVERITANLRDFLSTSSLVERYSDSFLFRAYREVIQVKNNLKRKIASLFRGGPVVRKGSVVVPTPKTEEREKVDLLRKHIEESFSDDVEIISDESKTSGVIKPVFRKDTGEEYLYVMVPVK